MLAAILSIGTELTRGELTNGNARWLGESLTALGCEVVEQATVADDSTTIGATLARFGDQVKVVVVTGGLGPTSDDLTADAVASLLGVPLERDAESLAVIEARYQRLGRVMPKSNVKQAEFPQGAQIMANAVGSAPGFAVTVGRARCYFMPGVPREMTHIFERHVGPELAGQVERTSHQVHLRLFGLPESEVADRLADLEAGGAEHDSRVTLGYRVHYPEIEVKVLARDSDAEQARALAEAVAHKVRARLGDAVYGGREDSFAGHVGSLLRRDGLKLAVAESCTGGIIGSMLTEVPGSSSFLVLDAVTYANEAKVGVLGVDAGLIETHGAVSAEVAQAMAEGVLKLADADVAISVTGIAGPEGGSEQKPVGTVYFGLARRGAASITRHRKLQGDRARIRTLAAYVSLRMIVESIHDTLDD